MMPQRPGPKAAKETSPKMAPKRKYKGAYQKKEIELEIAVECFLQIM